MSKTDELISKLEALITQYEEILKIFDFIPNEGSKSYRLKSEISQLKEQIKKEAIKEKIKSHISDAEPVVSKWIREDNEQIKNKELWTNDKVIDFVNWYLRLCKVITDKDCRFELENQNVIDSFLNGDDYKLWWDKLGFNEQAKKEDIKDINFIKWYSGMEEHKIRNAFKRYKNEVKQSNK
ncbi:MAG: hypothetical protein WC998_04790 [Candidatus Paceibacterota bacterium]|jgi:hypothetical protein